MKPLANIQSLIENLPLSICTRHKRNGKWVYNYCNNTWLKLVKSSKSDVIGHTLYEVLSKAGYPIYHISAISEISDSTDEELLINKTVKPYEFNLSWFDYLYIRTYKHLVTIDDEECILSAIFDISDRVKNEEIQHKLQESLLSSSKMQLIGEFSSGLAHELNNPLAVLQLSVEELQDKIAYCPRHQDFSDGPCAKCFKNVNDLLDSVRVSIEIIQNVMQSIQSHVSTFKLKESKVYYVKDLISDSLSLLKYKDKRHEIKVINETDESANTIFCCKADIVQVFVNLLVNAMDAVKSLEYDKRIVKVSTKYTDDDKTLIFIDDLGKGVPKHLKDQIFEPFVTTKRSSTSDKINLKSGCGLGLSISRQLMRYNNGFIRYKRQGRMTRFICILPSKEL